MTTWNAPCIKDELCEARPGHYGACDPNERAKAALANARRVSGDNMDFAMRYRNVLQALLVRHNGDGDSLALTILSPADVTEIKAALDWLGD